MAGTDRELRPAGTPLQWPTRTHLFEPVQVDKAFLESRCEQIMDRDILSRCSELPKSLALNFTIGNPVRTAAPKIRLSAGSVAGDRGGHLSIRIKDQYRICFTWQEGSAYDVEIVDYHS